MKLIKLESSATKEELLAMLSDNERVTKNVKTEDNGRKGTPFMHVKESSGKLRIKCEYIGGATKDNAFIDGTHFSGKNNREKWQDRDKGRDHYGSRIPSYLGGVFLGVHRRMHREARIQYSPRMPHRI